MTGHWGKPSFSKKWHFFTMKGSLCNRYEANEVPEVLLGYPENYDKICDGCLLALAKANLGRLIGWAPKGINGEEKEEAV